MRNLVKKVSLAALLGLVFGLSVTAVHAARTYIDVINNKLVADKIELAGAFVGGSINGATVSTTSNVPANTIPGDLILGVVTMQNTGGPGFGAMTLRARRSVTVPGACALWAVGGSATQETLIKDGIAGTC